MKHTIGLAVATVERQKVKKPKKYLEKRILRRGFTRQPTRK